jgi:2,3-bisphosphoglycerate-independent phosphoglycerate mutase
MGLGPHHAAADLQEAKLETPSINPVMLCILDGWGYRADPDNNAVAQAHTPHFDALWHNCPKAFLQASASDVGLPQGQIGNSEVGHLNIGAGRLVWQDLPMIDRALASGILDHNPTYQGLLTLVRASKGRLHIMGLTSPGGVHAHQQHLTSLINHALHADIGVVVHILTDGRDVPPASAFEQVKTFLASLTPSPKLEIASLTGRYYAMDRDQRWERVALAYQAIVLGQAPRQLDPLSAIKESYKAGKQDEFIEPVIFGDYQGMQPGDGLIMANFRADRARQFLTALLDPDFTGFARPKPVALAGAVGMVEYSEKLNKFMGAIFPPKDLVNVLGAVVAGAGLKQLRAAETEKYPHVTFFLNGGREAPFVGEDRILVPSPKVATYDLQPEMSAPELAAKVVTAIDQGIYGLIILNFANPDMVGHTGSLAAAIKAVETVDTGLGQIIAAIKRQGGALLVTADHGNCEQMWDYEENCPHTAHTLNPVPVVLLGAGERVSALRDGRLADIAPTLLALMGLQQPAEMDGHSLLVIGKGASLPQKHLQGASL